MSLPQRGQTFPLAVLILSISPLAATNQITLFTFVTCHNPLNRTVTNIIASFQKNSDIAKRTVTSSTRPCYGKLEAILASTCCQGHRSRQPSLLSESVDVPRLEITLLFPRLKPLYSYFGGNKWIYSIELYMFEVLGRFWCPKRVRVYHH